MQTKTFTELHEVLKLFQTRLFFFNHLMNGKKTNIHFFPLLFNQNGLTFPSAWLNLIQASSRLSALDLCFSQSIYFRRLAIVNSFYIPLKCKSSQPPASFTTQKCLFQGPGSQYFEMSVPGLAGLLGLLSLQVDSEIFSEPGAPLQAQSCRSVHSPFLFLFVF